MDYQNILLHVQNGIAIITLNRPKAWNALCTELNMELEDALRKVDADQTVRVVILTGGPKVFAAGADIKQMVTADVMEASRTACQGQQINEFIEQMSIPVIAAVNGMALGGGCELSMACDFRVVARDAVFGQPEVGLGILPGAGGTQRLAALVGVTKAREMVMLGTQITGEDALTLGLATCVVDSDKVMETAIDMAKKLQRKPAYALAMAKQAIAAGQNMGLGTGKLMERYLFALTFGNPDQAEGMQAFAEKRRPAYSNER
ncbi:MAG: enoyl-CoA hydratase-related protein [Intestinimonas massiliensis]|uniref:enoyl-CoA hydratase/isomerase family protein n=1 Tax=Intestinimonas TaxID=1392389 RepID=UPI0024327C57|nr:MULTISPECIES: enoyl-CoA hydratase-related protein [Intestinimonas]MCI5563042.1 enoyl-CoA hydratase-related protein [Intestinimonas massiliensis (ex Afouda et al. 2020)]MDY5337967.1 enoyl-CoA hydratase-related protein [Intestinimonas sp.]